MDIYNQRLSIINGTQLHIIANIDLVIYLTNDNRALHGLSHVVCLAAVIPGIPLKAAATHCQGCCLFWFLTCSRNENIQYLKCWPCLKH